MKRIFHHFKGFSLKQTKQSNFNNRVFLDLYILNETFGTVEVVLWKSDSPVSNMLEF